MSHFIPFCRGFKYHQTSFPKILHRHRLSNPSHIFFVYLLGLSMHRAATRLTQPIGKQLASLILKGAKRLYIKDRWVGYSHAPG